MPNWVEFIEYFNFSSETPTCARTATPQFQAAADISAVG